MADILDQFKDRLAIVQAAQATEANKNRHPHNFQYGDRVMISTRNMPMSYGAAAPGTETNQFGAQLSRTLHQRYVGPYKFDIQRCNGNAFKITDIPENLRIYKTYNVGLAPWRSGIAPENIGGVYGHNAMGWNPSASPPV